LPPAEPNFTTAFVEKELSVGEKFRQQKQPTVPESARQWRYAAGLPTPGGFVNYWQNQPTIWSGPLGPDGWSGMN
jgi:hypothetical protein